jgi:hypothetical protein
MNWRGFLWVEGLSVGSIFLGARGGGGPELLLDDLVMLRFGLSVEEEDAGDAMYRLMRAEGKETVRIVLITGFESFNVDLYNKVR